MKSLHLVSVLFVLLILGSCKPGYFRASQYEKMKWLDGTWSSTDQGITIAEIWKFQEDIGFNGISYIATGRDTLYFERLVVKQGPKRTMVLESETGQVQFEASEPMTLIRLKKGSFTFKEMSSSKTVTYRNVKGQVLQIIIREELDGNETKTKYELKRQ